MSTGSTAVAARPAGAGLHVPGHSSACSVWWSCVSSGRRWCAGHRLLCFSLVFSLRWFLFPVRSFKTPTKGCMHRSCGISLAPPGRPNMLQSGPEILPPKPSTVQDTLEPSARPASQGQLRALGPLPKSAGKGATLLSSQFDASGANSAQFSGHPPVVQDPPLAGDALAQGLAAARCNYRFPVSSS